jgi:hypothetical protein
MDYCLLESGMGKTLRVVPQAEEAAGEGLKRILLSKLAAACRRNISVSFYEMGVGFYLFCSSS